MKQTDEVNEVALLERWARLSSATIHEAAGRVGALPSAIKPIASHLRLAGRALPVDVPAGDNLWLHRAIYAAEPGDVIVGACAEVEFGYWGEIMTVAAQQRGIAGLLVTGGVRDTARLISLGFPAFAGAVCIRGTGKDPSLMGRIGSPVRIGDVVIAPGDLVLGDADGVVVIPQARAAEVVAKAELRDEGERKIFERLRAGETTLDLFRLPG